MWKILVVDDNFVDRKLVCEMLRGKAECDIAANAKEAIDAHNLALEKEKPYDALLLDVEMPDTDGVELLRTIRKSEKLAGVKLGQGALIIMVTAHEKPLWNAFYKGCDDYIVKPLQAESLIKRIEENLKKKKQAAK